MSSSGPTMMARSHGEPENMQPSYAIYVYIYIYIIYVYMYIYKPN
jgi:hypothetical protein